MNQTIANLLKAAVECSVFINPTDPGLLYDELLEVGQRAGFQRGEVGDAAIQIGERRPGSLKFTPDHLSRMSWQFFFYEEPDYRNFEALDLVVSELNTRVKADGARNARVERSVLVERATTAGIPRKDAEAAATYLILAEIISEKHGLLAFLHQNGTRDLPSRMRDQIGHRALHRRPERSQAYPIVKDLIERRSDGRPKSVEPLAAFAEQLDGLKYGRFRLWWNQTVAELRVSDPNATPTSTTVLAAALVEGTLTFVVTHARALNLGVFRSSDFDQDPRKWKIENLVNSAASGGDAAILDAQTKNRTEVLIRNRHRIHAGRMLSEFPTGVPDIRPEEARDAKTTADQVVRRVLDWLERFPPRGS